MLFLPATAGVKSLIETGTYCVIVVCRGVVFGRLESSFPMESSRRDKLLQLQQRMSVAVDSLFGMIHASLSCFSV